MQKLILTGALLCSGIALATSGVAGERAVPVTEPSSAQIAQRIDNIERLLQNQGLLDMLQQIERLQQEVTELRGQLEVNNHELEKLKERQRKLYNDIDTRLQRLSTQAPGVAGIADAEVPPLETITPAESVAAAGNRAESVLTVETIPATPEAEPLTTATEPAVEETLATVSPEPTAANPVEIQAHYQEAFRLLKQAEYDQAITAFDKFLNKYPDSQYSDNAQYWMGEAYYVTRRFEAAITEYMKLISNHPQSQRVPNGLLKIGYSYFELGKPEEAKKALNELIEKFPGTSAANDAEERLKQSAAS